MWSMTPGDEKRPWIILYSMSTRWKLNGKHHGSNHLLYHGCPLKPNQNCIVLSAVPAHSCFTVSITGIFLCFCVFVAHRVTLEAGHRGFQVTAAGNLWNRHTMINIGVMNLMTIPRPNECTWWKCIPQWQNVVRRSHNIACMTRNRHWRVAP